MLNKTGITKTSAITPNQILFDMALQMSVSIIVANDGIVADSSGKKIIKAGTPMAGSLDQRELAFKKATTGVTGVLLHDVDVTEGNTNATLLIFGFVNTNRLDVVTSALITTEVKAMIPAVVFLKD